MAAASAAGAATRSAVRLTVRGRSTATSTAAQVPHASTAPCVPRRGCARRARRRGRVRRAGGAAPRTPRAGQGPVRTCMARRDLPTRIAGGHSRDVQIRGKRWLGSTNEDEGRRPSSRRGQLDRQPPAHRPSRRGHASCSSGSPDCRPRRRSRTARDMERMIAQAAWGIAGVQVLARRLARPRRPDPRPPRPAHHRGHRRRAVRRPASLPRRGRPVVARRSSCSSPAR